jgi:diguanylate cyclase (GGDEF)-like protein
MTPSDFANPLSPSDTATQSQVAIADSTAAVPENLRIQAELEERLRECTKQLEVALTALQAETSLRRQLEAKVIQLSLTDELTGLSNRRGFLLHAEQTLKLVRRVQTQGWLVYIDIDGLKHVNDTLGHDAGDQLIRSAAKVLSESFRDADILGRIGGDEFIAFATGLATPAVEIELRLRNNIAHHNQFFQDQPPLSMSIGIVPCDPHALNTLEDIIHQADAAMYIEKRRKRAYLQNESGN